MIPNDSPCPVIEAALPADVTAIIDLLTPNVSKNSILPRSTQDILANIHAFRVARCEGQVVGCVALKDYSNGLFEIRSLAVAPAASGQGLGTRLLTAIIQLATECQGKEIFTLTVRPNLFRRLDFHVVAKERFPQKIWSDCAACKKRDQCDEVALAKHLVPNAKATW